MKTGFCAMTGFMSPTLQRNFCYYVVLAMSGLYQAARRYLRCSRCVARFGPATGCLALAVVFSGTVGAVAQTAVPGPDQKVAPGAMVVLDGSASTPSPGNTITTYSWVSTSTQDDCDPAPMHPTSGVRISFIAEDLAPGAADVTYCFFMKVDQANGDGSPWVPLNVTVSHSVMANTPPVANAGLDRTVAPGVPVTLDGSGSRVSSPRILTYAWMRSLAPDRGNAGNVELTGANTAMPTFTPISLDPGAPNATYGFTLTVTDNVGATHTDMVTITVTAANAPPVAEAGADVEVNSGTTPVPLDGRGSIDNGGSIATYLWARTGGTTGASGTLINANMAQASFTPDSVAAGAADVTHEFTLTVTDDDGATHTDMVTITVNAPPVANAGLDRTVGFGAPVTLDGSGSSDTTGTFTYAWMRSVAPDRGNAGNVTLIGENTATPTFNPVPLDPGAPDVTYGFTLTVTDSDGVTAVAMVTITVTAGNLPPVVNAGIDQTVDPGDTVSLTGATATDPDGNDTIAGYAWTRTGGTAGVSVSIMNQTSLDMAQFIAEPRTLAPGAADVEHIITLTATDDDGVTGTDTVKVTVVSRFAAPVANAGDDQTVLPGTVVTLDGTGSESDRRIPIATYAWERTGGTPGVTVTLTGADTATPTFTAPMPTGATDVEHIFTLTVTNEEDMENDDMVTVTVRAQEDDPILDHVGQFIATRATALLAQQPDLTRFLKQDGPTKAGDGGAFNFQATDGLLSLNGGFIHNGTWGEVTGAWIDNKSGDTESVLASFGIHRKYSETFLAGAMLQFDLAERDLSQQAGTIDGTGWLVGPYFVARHGSQPVYFEGRMLYGQSDNDIRFIDPALGVRTGSFDSKRLLAQVRVEGDIAFWDRVEGSRLIPYADARWVEDRAAAFTDNINNRVPGQKISIGQLELGSNVEIPIAVDTGAMTLTGGLGLVWSNTEGDYIPSDSGGRGRGEIGLSYALDDNLRIGFESFYDGIGSSGYEGYGLSLSAEMKF